jgi:anaerobic magnesium-protoporphyrin IX monomethyl ester cyclase
MKILLANLPWEKNGNWGVRAGSRWPHIKNKAEGDYLPFPFFLAYAAALLKKNDFEVLLVDAIAEKMPGNVFLAKVWNFNPDLFVAETSTVSLEHDLLLLQRINKDIPIAICGPDINIREPEFLIKNPYIKYVLKGEYEFILLDLVKHLVTGSDLKEVKGLIFLDDTGRLSLNEDRPLVKNLDDFAWPLREGLPMYKYLDAPGCLPTPSVQMMASRGCPYTCSFCLWPHVMYPGNAYRTRSPKDVVDEMEFVVKQYKFKSVYFDDDTFNVGKQRVLEICREINQRNNQQRLNVPWAIMARADIMDEEILVNLKKANLYSIKYGIESASQHILDKSKKNLNIEKAVEMVTLTKQMGIKVHLTFMFGLNGETKKTIRETIELALSLDPYSVQFSIATPFPGTEYFNELDKDGFILSKNWAEYDGNNKSVITTKALKAQDLVKAKNTAYLRWEMHSFYKKAAALLK